MVLCIFSMLDSMSKHPRQFYNCMATEQFDAKLADSSTNFLFIYKDVSDTQSNDPFWKAKPTFYSLAELTDLQMTDAGNPPDFLQYADERFKGIIAYISKKRGSQRKASTVPANVIDRYQSTSMSQ